MKLDPVKRWLLAAAVVLGLAGAAFGRTRERVRSVPVASWAPAGVAPFALAHTLAQAPPDVVVVALDDARHPLRGAMPMALYGATDEEFIARAPRGVRLVLASRDLVRMDRVARRLMATGHAVTVLAGGTAAWDAAMSADPAAPAATDSPAAWARYRYEVALRRAFGEAASAPAAPVAAPALPRPAAGSAAAGGGRREGC